MSEAFRYDPDDQTLRDYFAAHAPQPPDWFQPLMEPRPQIPAIPPGLSDEAAHLCDSWRCDPHYVDLEVSAAKRGFGPTEILAMQAWARDVLEAEKAMVAYDRRRLVERTIQWPWHYADLMLRARERNVAQVDEPSETEKQLGRARALAVEALARIETGKHCGSPGCPAHASEIAAAALSGQELPVCPGHDSAGPVS